MQTSADRDTPAAIMALRIKPAILLQIAGSMCNSRDALLLMRMDVIRFHRNEQHAALLLLCVGDLFHSNLIGRRQRSDIAFEIANV